MAVPSCTLASGPLLSWGRALPRVPLPSAHSIFFDAWHSRQDINCSLLIEDDIEIPSHLLRPNHATEKGEKQRGMGRGAGKEGRQASKQTASGERGQCLHPMKSRGVGISCQSGREPGCLLVSLNLMS